MSDRLINPELPRTGQLHVMHLGHTGMWLEQRQQLEYQLRYRVEQLIASRLRDGRQYVVQIGAMHEQEAESFSEMTFHPYNTSYRIDATLVLAKVEDAAVGEYVQEGAVPVSPQRPMVQLAIREDSTEWVHAPGIGWRRLK